MAYVITDRCSKDLMCVDQCPTAAIAPAAGDAALAGVTQLFINPEDCLDCGSCASVCPQNAIFPLDELPAELESFAEKNRAYFN